VYEFAFKTFKARSARSSRITFFLSLFAIVAAADDAHESGILSLFGSESLRTTSLTSSPLALRARWDKSVGLMVGLIRYPSESVRSW
jgi:hypothetical protein